jgi:vitamin B12 transporter
MKRLSLGLFGLTLSFVFVTGINAAEQEEQEAVIVTATRTAQTVDENLSPVVIISREDLENEVGAEITDILHRYPGIDVSRSGGPGQQSSVFIRGAESDHTLVMINGIKINPGTIGTASIQNISLDMIERIEIVKGPRSTLYGSDAIGGVINIITRKQKKEGTHFEANIGGGSFDTTSAGFSAHNNSGNGSAGINVNASQSDGFPTLTTETLDRGYDNLSVNLYGKKRLGETDTTIEHWQAEGTTEYFGYDALFNLVPLDQDFKTSTTAVSFDSNPTANWVSKLKLSYFDDNIEQNQSNDYVRTRRTSLDWQNDIQAGDWQLITAGLYLSDENAASISYGTSFDVDTDVNAVFVQDNISIKGHQLVAGARYSDHESYGNHTTWNLEYGYQLTQRWKLIAAANTGFRSPSSTDRFGYGGNPDLKPEESQNHELGIRYRKNSHAFTINAFDNQIDELIVYYDPDGFLGPLPGSNQNIAETRIKGVEANYQYTSDNWLFTLGAIDQNPLNVTDNTLLLKRPEQKYNLSVGHKGGRHLIQLDMTHVSERVDYGDIPLDAYTLIGLKGEYRFSKKLSASGRIENLTDEDYALADGYNTPERSYYLKLGYVF